MSTFILPSENAIQGQWVFVGTTMTGDSNCVRIANAIEHDLVLVRDSGWLRLFRERDTGHFWLLRYPQGEMHGGGPPRLERVTAQEAAAHFPT